MALAPCVECGKEISTEARTCPNCGKENPTAARAAAAQPKKKRNPLVTALLIVIGIGVVGAIASEGNKDLQQAPVDPAKVAADSVDDQLLSSLTLCRRAIEKSLKSPSTAQFPDFYSSFKKDEGNGLTHVQVQVDAQNSFGGMMRSTFDCKVQRAADQYLLMSLKELSR